jgi:hypothetical protein
MAFKLIRVWYHYENTMKPLMEKVVKFVKKEWFLFITVAILLFIIWMFEFCSFC